MLFPFVLSSQINPKEIDIIRDKYGVPHIYAKTDAEVAYGLAWAHAEDDFSTIQNNPINLCLTCATGDSFINSDEMHTGDVVDMEAYSLAKVCNKYQIPFISFKYISDNAGNDAEKDWIKNCNIGEGLFKTIVLEPLGLI